MPRYRFPEFTSYGTIIAKTGNMIFDATNNKNHNADLPILAVTQEHGVVPRDSINYNVTVTEKSLENYKVVEKGDFIISLRAFQGGIEYSEYHGICSPAYITLRKKTDISDSYYKHYFKSFRFIRDLNKDIEGLRDGKIITYRQFSSIYLPVPPKNEQEKIAACLSSIDRLISAEEKKLSLLNDYKKSWMQKLFPAEGESVPAWRFPEFSQDGSWKRTVLSKVTTYVDYRGKTPRKTQKGIFLITAKNIKMGYIDYDSSREYVPKENYYAIMSRGLPEIGDVLITTEAPCGNIAQIDRTDVAIAQRIIKYRGIDGTINNTFLKYIFLSPVFQNELHKKMVGGVVKGIKGSVLHKMLIAFPDNLLEQKKIADFFSEIDHLIYTQVNKISRLRNQKISLVQGLFPSMEEIEK